METTPNTVPGGETPNGTVPPGETPTTPKPGETPGTGTTTEQSPADLQKEIERLTNSLKRANAEAKENRLAKEELDKLKLAEMDEKQRLEVQLSELQSRHANEVRELQERLTRAEIQRAALQFNIDPKLAVRALDWAEIEHDEQGNPKNIDTLFKKLLQEFPNLTKQQSQSPSPGNGPNPRPAAGTPDTARQNFMTNLRRSGKYGA